MDEAGTLHEDARVELIKGEIIDMRPIGSGHAGIVSQFSRILDRAVEDRDCVDTESRRSRRAFRGAA